MYLKINEVQRAQENLREAIKIDDTSTKSLLALGAILQVEYYLLSLHNN